MTESDNVSCAVVELKWDVEEEVQVPALPHLRPHPAALPAAAPAQQPGQQLHQGLLRVPAARARGGAVAGGQSPALQEPWVTVCRVFVECRVAGLLSVCAGSPLQG